MFLCFYRLKMYQIIVRLALTHPRIVIFFFLLPGYAVVIMAVNKGHLGD